jgi:hypothetical protein
MAAHVPERAEVGGLKQAKKGNRKIAFFMSAKRKLRLRFTYPLLIESLKGRR